MEDQVEACQSFLALVLWLLGYPDQALMWNQKALTRARELAHPFTLASALLWAAIFHQHRQDGPAAQRQAEEEVKLATEQGFPNYVVWGTIAEGWTLAEQGKEGIAQIRDGIADCQDVGAEIARPYTLALLAEAYGKAGQAEEGLMALAKALATVGKTGERHYEAELYRLKGMLLLESNAQGPKSKVAKEAEECFRKAIGVARRQQAKSLELRAVISLSQLWQQQGRKEDARRILAEIYDWFKEGSETKDLQEAKVLLNTLS